jgi:hypothetical protein
VYCMSAAGTGVCCAWHAWCQGGGAGGLAARQACWALHLAILQRLWWQCSAAAASPLLLKAWVHRRCTYWGLMALVVSGSVASSAAMVQQDGLCLQMLHWRA